MSEDLKSLIQQIDKSRKEIEEFLEERKRDKMASLVIGFDVLLYGGCILVFIIALCLVFSSECKADTLYLGQKSHHFNPVGEDIVRESHALVVYEHSSGWMGGYWRNSYDRDTYSVGYHYYLWKTANKGEPDMSLGLKAGLVTGYDYPAFGAINVQMGYVDVNIVPTEVISVGLKFDF